MPRFTPLPETPRQTPEANTGSTMQSYCGRNRPQDSGEISKGKSEVELVHSGIMSGKSNGSNASQMGSVGAFGNQSRETRNLKNLGIRGFLRNLVEYASWPRGISGISGECFAPICAHVSRRHVHSAISLELFYWFLPRFSAPGDAAPNPGSQYW